MREQGEHTLEEPESGTFALGRAGEEAAARYLWRKGYRILQSNYEPGRWEIDLIAEKNRRIHFVEVKTRSSESLGHPEERVDAVKRQRLREAARQYLAEFRDPPEGGTQFDVVAVLAGPDGRVEKLEHLENAF